MIADILPPAVAAAESIGPEPPPGPGLFPAEEALVRTAGPRRRAEFTAGRACARTALAGLGLAAAPVLAGRAGEPRLPAGVTGSITHCAGYRACAAARNAQVEALGIDAEPDGPLPAGVLAAVATRAEHAWLDERMSVAPQVRWDTLVFSAKEAAYKAWFPLTGATPGFADVEMTEPEDGRFTLHLLTPGREPTRPWPPRLEGGWLAGRGLIITAVAAPA